VNGYVIIIERADDGGYGAWAPDLPGCVATAEDDDTCIAEMREAIRSTSMACARTVTLFPSPRPAR
jgi:predicted RNase H-like HicB family nuclease